MSESPLQPVSHSPELQSDVQVEVDAQLVLLVQASPADIQALFKSVITDHLVAALKSIHQDEAPENTLACPSVAFSALAGSNYDETFSVETAVVNVLAYLNTVIIQLVSPQDTEPTDSGDDAQYCETVGCSTCSAAAA